MTPQYTNYSNNLRKALQDGKADGSLKSWMSVIDETYAGNIDQDLTYFQGKGRTDAGAAKIASNLNAHDRLHTEAQNKTTALWASGKALEIASRGADEIRKETIGDEHGPVQAKKTYEQTLDSILSGGLTDAEAATRESFGQLPHPNQNLSQEEADAHKELNDSVRQRAEMSHSTRVNNGKPAIMAITTPQGTDLGGAQIVDYDGQKFAIVQFSHDTEGQPIPLYDENGKKNQMPTKMVPIDGDFARMDNRLEKEQEALNGRLRSLNEAFERAKQNESSIFPAATMGPGVLTQIQAEMEPLQEQLEAVTAKRDAIAAKGGREELYRLALDDAMRASEGLQQYIPRGKGLDFSAPSPREALEVASGPVGAVKVGINRLMDSAHGINAVGGFAIALKSQQAAAYYVASQAQEFAGYDGQANLEEAMKIHAETGVAEIGRTALAYGGAAYKGGTLSVIAQEVPAEFVQMAFDLTLGYVPAAGLRAATNQIVKKTVREIGERALSSGATKGMTEAAQRANKEFVAKQVEKRVGSWALPFISSIPGGLEEANQALRGFEDADELDAQAEALDRQAEEAEELLKPGATSIEGVSAGGAAIDAKASREKAGKLRLTAQLKREGVSYAFYTSFAATGLTDMIGLERILRVSPKVGMDDLMRKNMARKALISKGTPDITEKMVDEAAEKLKKQLEERVAAKIANTWAFRKTKDMLEAGVTEGVTEGLQAATNTVILNEFLLENEDIFSQGTFDEAAVGFTVGLLMRGMTGNVKPSIQKRLINDVAERTQAEAKQSGAIADMAKDALRESGINGYAAAAPAKDVVNQRKDGLWVINDAADQATLYAPGGYFHGISFTSKAEAEAFAENRWKHVTHAVIEDVVSKEWVALDDKGQATENKEINKRRVAEVKHIMDSVFSEISTNQGTHSENVFAAFARTLQVGENTPIDFGPAIRPEMQAQEDLALAVITLAMEPTSMSEEVRKQVLAAVPGAHQLTAEIKGHAEKSKKAMDHVLVRMEKQRARARALADAADVSGVGVAAAEVETWTDTDEELMLKDSDAVAEALGISLTDAQAMMGDTYTRGQQVPEGARDAVREKALGKKKAAAAQAAMRNQRMRMYLQRVEKIRKAGRKMLADAVSQIPEPKYLEFDPGATTPEAMALVNDQVRKIQDQRTAGPSLTMAQSPGGELSLFQDDNPEVVKTGKSKPVQMINDDLGIPKLQVDTGAVLSLLQKAIVDGVLPDSGGIPTPKAMRSPAALAETLLIAGAMKQNFIKKQGRNPTVEESQAILGRALNVVYGPADDKGERSGGRVERGGLVEGKLDEVVNDKSNFAPSIDIDYVSASGERKVGQSQSIMNALAKAEKGGHQQVVINGGGVITPGFQGVIRMDRWVGSAETGHLSSVFVLISKATRTREGKIEATLLPVTRYYAQLRTIFTEEAQRKALAAGVAIGLKRSSALRKLQGGANAAEALGLPADMLNVNRNKERGEDGELARYENALEGLIKNSAVPPSVRRLSEAVASVLSDAGLTPPQAKPREIVADYLNRLAKLSLQEASREATVEFAKKIAALNTDDNLSVPVEDASMLTVEQRVESMLLTMAGNGTKAQMIDALMLQPSTSNLVKIPMGPYNFHAADGHPDKVNMKDDITAGRFMVSAMIKTDGRPDVERMLLQGMKEAATRGKDASDFRLLRTGDGVWFRLVGGQWREINKGLYTADIGNKGGVFPGMRLSNNREGRLAQMSLINALNPKQKLDESGFNAALQRFSGTTQIGYRDIMGASLHRGMLWEKYGNDNTVITRVIDMATRMREAALAKVEADADQIGRDPLVYYQKGSASPVKRSGDKLVDDGKDNRDEDGFLLASSREEGSEMDDSPMVKGFEKALWDMLRGVGQMSSVTEPTRALSKRGVKPAVPGTGLDGDAQQPADTFDGEAVFNDDIEGVDEMRMALINAMSYAVGDMAEAAGVDLSELQDLTFRLFAADEATSTVSDAMRDSEPGGEGGKLDAEELGEGGSMGIVKDEQQFQTVVNVLKSSNLIPQNAMNQGEYTLELWVRGEPLPIEDDSDTFLNKDGTPMSEKDAQAAKWKLHLEKGTDMSEMWQDVKDKEAPFQESSWGRRRVTGEYNLLDPEDLIYRESLKEGDLVIVDGVEMELVEVKKKDGLNLAKLKEPDTTLLREFRQKELERERERIAKGLASDQVVQGDLPSVQDIDSLVNDTLVTSKKKAAKIKKNLERAEKIIANIKARAIAKTLTGEKGVLSPRIARAEHLEMAELRELLRDELVAASLSKKGAFSEVDDLDLVTDSGGQGLADMRQKLAGSIWYKNRVKPLKHQIEEFFYAEKGKPLDVPIKKPQERLDEIRSAIERVVGVYSRHSIADLNLADTPGSEAGRVFIGTVLEQVRVKLEGFGVGGKHLPAVLSNYREEIHMAQLKITETTGSRNKSSFDAVVVRGESSMKAMGDLSTQEDKTNMAMWQANALLTLQAEMLDLHYSGRITHEQLNIVMGDYSSAWMQGRYKDDGKGDGKGGTQDQHFGSVMDNLTKAMMPVGWTTPSSPKGVNETDAGPENDYVLRRPKHPTTGWVNLDIDKAEADMRKLARKRSAEQAKPERAVSKKEGESLPAPGSKEFTAMIAQKATEWRNRLLHTVIGVIPRSLEKQLRSGDVTTMLTRLAIGSNSDGKEYPMPELNEQFNLFKEKVAAAVKSGENTLDGDKDKMLAAINKHFESFRNETSPGEITPIKPDEVGESDVKPISQVRLDEVLFLTKGQVAAGKNKPTSKPYVHVQNLLEGQDVRAILETNADLMAAWQGQGQLEEFLKRSISGDPALRASYNRFASGVRLSLRSSDTQELEVQSPEKEELLNLVIQKWEPTKEARLLPGQAGSGLGVTDKGERKRPVTLYQSVGKTLGEYRSRGALPHGIINFNPGNATPETFIHEMMHWLNDTRLANGASLLETTLGPAGYGDLMAWATDNGRMDPDQFEDGSEAKARAWRFTEERIANSISLYFANGISTLRGAAPQIVSLSRMMQSVWKARKGALQEEQKEFYKTAEGRAVITAYDKVFLRGRGAFELATTADDVDSIKMIQMIKDAHPNEKFTDEEILKIIQMAQDIEQAPLSGIAKPMVAATGEGRAADDPKTAVAMAPARQAPGSKPPPLPTPKSKAGVTNAAKILSNRIKEFTEKAFKDGGSIGSTNAQIRTMIDAEGSAEVLAEFAKMQRSRAEKAKKEALRSAMLSEAEYAENKAKVKGALRYFAEQEKKEAPPTPAQKQAAPQAPYPIGHAGSMPTGFTHVDGRGDVWTKTDDGWTLSSHSFEDSPGVGQTRWMGNSVAQDEIGSALAPKGGRSLQHFEPSTSVATGPKERSGLRKIAARGEYGGGRYAQLWKAARWTASSMTARNGGPDEFFRANLEQRRWRSAIQARLTFIMDDIQRAIDRTITVASSPERLTEVYRSMNNLLTAPTVADRARFQQELNALGGPELSIAVMQARAIVDDLSRKLMDDGIVHGKLAIAVSRNLGTYLHRTFPHLPKSGAVEMIFGADGRAPLAKYQQLLTRAYADLISSGVVADEVEGEALIRSVLDKITTDEPDLFQENGMGVPAALMRRAITDEQLAVILAPLTGMEMNPLVRVAKTVAKVTEVIANHNFQAAIRDVGLEKGWVGMPDNQEFSQVIGKVEKGQAAPKSYLSTTDAEDDPNGAIANGPLSGFRMRPETFQWYKTVMEDDYGAKARHPAVATMMWMNGTFKVLNTVWSWSTAVKNVVSSFLHMVSNGYIAGMGESWENVSAVEFANWGNKGQNPARLAKIEAARQLYLEAIEIGAAEGGLLADVQDMFDNSDVIMNGWLGGLASSVDNSSLMMSGAGYKIKRAIQKTRRAHQRFYMQGDSFFKMSAYNSEKSRLMKMYPGRPLGEIKKMAAERANSVMFSFDLEPKLIRNWKRFMPLAGNFMSFPIGQLRARVATVMLACHDMREGKRRMDAGEDGGSYQMWMGAHRMGTFSAGTLAMSKIATSYLASLLGWGEEEMDALNELVPEWDRDAILIPMGNFVPGEKAEYMNLSTLLPDAYWQGAVEQLVTLAGQTVDVLTSGGDGEIEMAEWEARFARSAAHIFGPFTDETMSAQAISSIFTGLDQYGKPLSSARSGPFAVAQDRITHIAKSTLIPGTAKTLARIEAGPNALNKMILGRQPKHIEGWRKGLTAFGFPTRSVNPREELKYVIGNAVDNLFNAKSDISSYLRKKGEMNTSSTMKDIQEAMADARIAVNRTNRVLHAAAAMGLTPKEIAGQVGETISKTDKRTIAKDVMRWIWQGEVSGPIRMSNQLKNDIIDAAEASGDDRISLVRELIDNGDITFESGR